jgi:hypothetical protein
LALSWQAKGFNQFPGNTQRCRSGRQTGQSAFPELAPTGEKTKVTQSGQ